MFIEIFFVVLAGLVFGSFITMASYRLPREEDIIVKPSRCPKCETQLGFKDLWPVLSWVASAGKCFHCKAPISIRYPLIEMATAGVFLLIYSRYDLSLQAVLLALMAVALLVMIVADLEHYIIPDEVHYALAPLAVGYNFLIGRPWEYMIGGLIVGAAIGLLLHHGYRWLRKKEGLGFGDVKFLAVAGLWLGTTPILPYLTIAPFLFYAGVIGTLSGLLWRALGKGHLFPFGPALAVALFLCIAFPESLNLFFYIGYIINQHFISVEY